MRNRFIRKTLVAAFAAAGIGSAFAQGFLTQAQIDARTKIFGIENVDPRTGELPRDKVIYSWLGHVSAAVSLRGRIIYTEAYIPRLEVTPGRTPFVIKDLVDVKPEAIFIGHGHGDHADNAAFIAVKTGATLYMSPEACGTAQNALTRMKNDPFIQADPVFAIDANATLNCVGLTTAGSTPGTQVVRVHQLEPLVCINAFRGFHSIAVPVDPDWGPVVVVDNPDPRDAELYPPGVRLTPNNPRLPGQQDIRQGGGPGGVDQINYQFVVRAGTQFALFHNSSVGAMKEGKGSNWPNGTPEDGQRMLQLLRRLPQTDVAFSTLSSANTDENGWRDSVYWAEAMRPRIMYTGHVTLGAALQYHSGFLNHLRLMEEPRALWPGFPSEEWPIVRNNTDPTDLLKPQVFEINSPAWDDNRRDNRRAMREFCG